jgi:hypothetical protein
MSRPFVSFTERDGGEAWARFEAALNAYFDAEIALLQARADACRELSGKREN